MSGKQSKILVVDDEPQIVRVLRRGLESNGFEVRAAPDGHSAMDIFRAWSADLIITDLAMPESDGLEVCRKVRKISMVPIVVLSVHGEEVAKVEALDLGADDYITKPFGMDELLARVRALLRRSAKPLAKPDKPFTMGDFSADPAQRKIAVREKEIHLTPKEYDLLMFLLANPHRVLTHRAILAEIWGNNSAEQNEYLRVFVGQLRKKLERNPASPQYIRTEPWIGYRFDPGD